MSQGGQMQGGMQGGAGKGGMQQSQGGAGKGGGQPPVMGQGQMFNRLNGMAQNQQFGNAKPYQPNQNDLYQHAQQLGQPRPMNPYGQPYTPAQGALTGLLGSIQKQPAQAPAAQQQFNNLIGRG